MGHSRHSYPFDKRIPKGYKQNPLDESIGYYGYDINDKLYFAGGSTSPSKQVAKHMHKKKQRQHDRQLENQIR